MTYCMSQELAEKKAAEMSQKHVGEYDDNGRVVITEYVPERYPGTKLFGVREVWRYPDRLDLGTFNGGFIWFGTLEASA